MKVQFLVAAAAVWLIFFLNFEWEIVRVTESGGTEADAGFTLLRRIYATVLRRREY